jgi:hypothetical protein
MSPVAYPPTCLRRSPTLPLFLHGVKKSLPIWLETFPDKISFGTDSFPYNETLGAGELLAGVQSLRTALAAALAEMISAGESKQAADAPVGTRLSARQCCGNLTRKGLLNGKIKA